MLFMFLLTTNFARNSHISPRISLIFLKIVLNQKRSEKQLSSQGRFALSFNLIANFMLKQCQKNWID